jgi:hypothetical protein
MKITPLLYFLCSIFYAGVLNASGPVNARQFVNNKDWNFIENKGQLSDGKGNLVPGIKYFGHNGGAYLYCKADRISFVFTKVEKRRGPISEATGSDVNPMQSRLFRKGYCTASSNIKPVISTCHADLILVNSNPDALIVGSDQQEYYENYYSSHDANYGITNIHSFKKITYQNIYHGIDLILKCMPGNSLEYSFVVHPGGEINDIKLQWNGPDNNNFKDGRIIHTTSFGKIEESVPISYQKSFCKSFFEKKIIRSRFTKKGNLIGFKIGKYDKSKIIIIDPVISWSTYFGGAEMEYYAGVATDVAGNVFISGITYSDSGISTTGAFRVTYNPLTGNSFIAKFSPTGSIIWATYYGGRVIGEPVNCLATDAYGNVFLTGTSSDNSGIATTGAHQTIVTGKYNTFLAKFNPGGWLIWGTYFGGNFEDESHAVTTDLNGNIFITGNTKSTEGLATSGAYQTKLFNLGNGNAFIAKFDNNGILLWSTYFGGRGHDEGNGIVADLYGNILITGATSSSEGIATRGAYQAVYKGDGFSRDAFVAKFNANGLLLWATYYGGENDDEGNGIALDIAGSIYITGETQSTSGIATPGSFHPQITGSDIDAFLAKFSNDGRLDWGTYFGGDGFEEGFNIAADCSGKIFICGSTSSSSGIATPDAIQGYLSDRGKFFAQFTNTGNLVSSTYFPSGSGIALDGKGNIYIAGMSQGDSGLATNGAYQNARAGKYDATLTRFQFPKYYNDAGLLSIKGINDSICPDSLPVTFQFYNYGSKVINSARFDWSVNGILQKTYTWSGTLYPCSFINITIGKYTFSNGLYTVKAWVSNPNGVTDSTAYNNTATCFINIPKINPAWEMKSLNTFVKTFSAADKTFKESLYFWTFGDSTNATGKTVTHTYKNEGRYRVTLTICTEEYDSIIWVINGVQVNIYPNPYATQTSIYIKLPNRAHIQIIANDALGQFLGNVLDQTMDAGEYEIPFNSSLRNYRPAMYFLNFIIDGQQFTRKIIQLDSKFY